MPVLWLSRQWGQAEGEQGDLVGQAVQQCGKGLVTAGPARSPGAPQLTACFTSALICASTSAVTSVRANAAAHIEPSSSFAWSLNPSVA